MAKGDDLIRAARVRLSHPKTGRPYLAAALWALRFREEKTVPTMGVDNVWNCYYNPDVIATWPVETICTVLLHEIWHLLRAHHKRAAALGVTSINQMPWNIATDAEINDNIIAAGMPFPPGIDPVTPASIGQPKDRLAEEYYHSFPKQGQGGNGKGQGKGKPSKEFGGSSADGLKRPWEEGQGKGDQSANKGKSTPGNSPRRAIPEDLIRKQVAEEISKFPGTMPGEWKRWAGSVITPKQIPWQYIFRQVLGRFVTAGRKDDYSFTRMSRRSYPDRSLITPGIIGTLPDVAMAVDTSGSMNEEALTDAIGIVESVLEHLGRTYPITVLAGDTCVQAVSKTTQGKKVDLQGGGGTDMGELINHAATALKPRPQILVVVTDGYTGWPETAPAGMQVVVVLVCDGGSSPAWATTVNAWKHKE